MRTTSFLPALAGLLTQLGSVLAEDLLFVDSLQFVEYKEAITTLGYTAKVVTEAEWRAMTTADFAKFKAIILSDPNCVDNPSPVSFVSDTKAVWSPAVTGNMIVIGTDPTYHSGSQPGAVTLIDNSVRFAASGSGTGLYFALSCYYHRSKSATVDVLSEFGEFTVRGELGCYNDAHIVATSDAMVSLSDTSLSNWRCSVHEAFAEYPTSGPGGFQALAIAKGVLGVGSQNFADETRGLPYIISRGATPTGCGDGKYEPKFNEECDHGSDNGKTGDLCDKSCKCLYGVLDAVAGTCKSAPPTSSGMPGPYHNATSAPYPITTAYPTGIYPTAVYPASSAYPTFKKPCGDSIIGIEIIKVVEITEECPEGSTETTTVTSYLSTLQRPIYATSTPGFPCYACVFGKPKPTDFLTVVTEYCPSIAHPTPTVTYKMCSSCSENTVTTDSIPGCTSAATTCHSCVPYVTEVPHKHKQVSTYAVPTYSSSSTPQITYASSALPTGKTPYTPTTVPQYTYATAAAGRVAAGLGAVVAGLAAAL